MTKKVHIMRGASGSGKGTYIRNFMQPAKVVSTDNEFLVPMSNDNPSHPSSCHPAPSRYPIIFKEGRYYEYRFDPHRLAIAHSACYGKFLKALADGEPNIVVDNTNIHVWEFEKYILAAEMMSYEVRITALKITTVDEIKLCAERNSHGVPIDVIARMAYEFETHPYDHVISIPTQQQS